MAGIFRSFILRPLLLNVFICELFLFRNDIDIANNADDNTPCVVSSKTNLTIEKQSSDSLFTWFHNSGIRVNAVNAKWHFLVCIKNSRNNNVANNNKYKKRSMKLILKVAPKKLLGKTLFDELNIVNHMCNLCKKAIQKLNAPVTSLNFQIPYIT